MDTGNADLSLLAAQGTGCGGPSSVVSGQAPTSTVPLLSKLRDLRASIMHCQVSSAQLSSAHVRSGQVRSGQVSSECYSVTAL